MADQTSAQVHRFRHAVAAYLGKGETTYLSPKDARKLARALIACARDCEREELFSKSTFRTVNFSFTAPIAR